MLKCVCVFYFFKADIVLMGSLMIYLCSGHLAKVFSSNLAFLGLLIFHYRVLDESHKSWDQV